MNYHILTLFPEMVTQGLSESILGRAAKKGLLSVNAVNIPGIIRRIDIKKSMIILTAGEPAC